jgi:hypothetical protein
MSTEIGHCAECGEPVRHSGQASLLWCSEAHKASWMSRHPEESTRWIAVSDWTPEHRAMVAAILGQGEDC